MHNYLYKKTSLVCAVLFIFFHEETVSNTALAQPLVVLWYVGLACTACLYCVYCLFVLLLCTTCMYCLYDQYRSKYTMLGLDRLKTRSKPSMPFYVVVGDVVVVVRME